MNLTIPENTLLQLSDFIAANLGLNFPKERWNDLERNIIAACKEAGYKEIGKFIQDIISTSLTNEHIEILTAYLTNNETYFWREHETFELFEQKIIPDLMRLRKAEKRIRIWSAGCSTGEEPYSIAIALSRCIPDIKDWDITILASDISPRILRTASLGLYKQRAFRNTSQWLKMNYFTPAANNKFELIPEIKNMVKFQYLNLADDVYPLPVNNTNAMDIIFCRNVLMYFTEDRFRQVTHRFYNALVPGGFLVVSASELSQQNFLDYTAFNAPGMVFYQKPVKKIRNLRKTTFVALPPKPASIHKQKTDQPIKQTLTEPRKIEKAIGKQTHPTDEETLEEQTLLIRTYANKGNLGEALKKCEETIHNNKLEPRLYYLYAIILQENNQLTEAVASLKRAIYLNTNFVLSYYTLGNIYQRLGDVKNAKKSLAIVLSILNKREEEEIFFEYEGLSAGRFKEIVNKAIQTKVL